MHFVFFYHSLVSDWNHGNAHFLRGVIQELQFRGHSVRTFEPKLGWSVQNLVRDHGEYPLHEFRSVFPSLRSEFYDLESLDLDEALDGADLVLVHEWNDPELVARVGRHRRRRDYTLLFHDTHHRGVTDPESIGRYSLEDFDGVLAFGSVLSDLYRRRGWAQRAWTWHEAADTRLFRPLPAESHDGDVAWIGNWGDDERTAELQSFFVDPVVRLGVRARAFGVRYPEDAIARLAFAGIDYKGWLPNYRVPETLARHRVAVHIPRRPYVDALPGIPTIRVFEALACGVPLVCSQWHDTEGLFEAGKDYLLARSSTEMTSHLRTVLHEPAMAKELAEAGLNTVRARHSCAHRVDELLEIWKEIMGVSECKLLSLDPA